jgi:hypothetical protein
MPLNDLLQANWRQAHEQVLVVDPFLRQTQGCSINGQPWAVLHPHARFQDVSWEIPARASAHDRSFEHA